jgi:hypothetical protein
MNKDRCVWALGNLTAATCNEGGMQTLSIRMIYMSALKADRNSCKSLGLLLGSRGITLLHKFISLLQNVLLQLLMPAPPHSSSTCMSHGRQGSCCLTLALQLPVVAIPTYAYNNPCCCTEGMRQQLCRVTGTCSSLSHHWTFACLRIELVPCFQSMDYVRNGMLSAAQSL